MVDWSRLIPVAGNALSDLGYGLTQGNNVSSALKAAGQRTADMAQPRAQAEIMQRQEQERQFAIQQQSAQRNQTVKWLMQNNMPDLAEQFSMGMIDGNGLFAEIKARKTPAQPDYKTLGQGETLVEMGPNGPRPVYSAPKVAQGPATVQEYQFYADNELRAGRPPMSFLDYQRATSGGMSLSVDPETGAVSFTQGAIGMGGRDPGAMGKQLSAADAEMLKQVRAEAAAAADLNTILPQMDYGAGQVGYTGPFGDVYGAFDDIVKILPGDEGQRGAFRSNSTQAALTFVAKTKGAVSEKEMALFQQASPGLGNTPEGNKTLIAAMQAGANRKQTQAAFYDAYVAKNGSLSGVQGAWRKYVEENPIFVPDGKGGMAIQAEADPRPYLDAGASMTGGSMKGGTTPDAGAVPPGVDPGLWQYMSPEERMLWQN